MADVILELDSISKSFDGENVIDNLNLEIQRNEFITLLGPSGCGKSTTLRIIGGFVKPDEGRVLFEGKDITNLTPDKRNVNTVFQKYSLFPHMTVAENIAFGLKLKKKSQQYIKDKIAYALKLVNMEGYGNQSPTVLSGGQQQRVAIARAIVNEPKILLLDEPLGALDLKLRHEMQRELIKIKQEVGITFVYVTHDQEEALTMSDRIIVMNQGIIQQMGTSKSIYDEPQNAFVADFIGDSNIIDGIMKEDRLVQIQNVMIPCAVSYTHLELERNNYIEAVAKEYKVSVESLQKLVVKMAISEGQAKPVERPKSFRDKAEKKEDGHLTSQKVLLTWMIEDKQLFGKISQYISPEDFTEELYRTVAELLYKQYADGELNPAKILNHFTEEETHREAASLFHTRIRELTTSQEREQALKETILLVKKNSIDVQTRNLNPTDMAGLQSLMEEKRKLADLKKLHISID